MKKKKILITGGAGLIGSILIKNLGHKYEFSSIDLRKVEGIESTESSLDNLSQIIPAFKNIDTVIHLAADPAPDGSWDSVLKNNLISTYNVFEASRINKVKRVIFASSNHSEGGNYLDAPWKHICNGNFDLLKENDYDLVLLDLAMPEFTGEDVLDTLKKDGILDKQKVIIFSASSLNDAEMEKLVSDKGATRFLRKPVDIDELLNVLEKI